MITVPMALPDLARMSAFRKTSLAETSSSLSLAVSVPAKDRMSPLSMMMVSEEMLLGSTTDLLAAVVPNWKRSPARYSMRPLASKKRYRSTVPPATKPTPVA